MNAATQSASTAGPLRWVRPEIDLALESADQALQACRSDAAAADLARIGDGRMQLHQVRGALTVLGLDGVSQFAAALESLLDAIEQRTCPADEARIALAQRALGSIRHYLDELAGGLPDQPLRLLARYREVQAARGEERDSPGDLFFPDLDVAPPPRTGAPAPLAPDEAQRQLRQDRSRFQRGMLAWLRDPQDKAGVGEMLGAVRSIEATQASGQQRIFWWVASAFLCALGEGSLGSPADVKPLCARIDQQIRRRLEGAQTLDERLLRDALYLLAQADSRDATVQQVSAAYRLPAAIAVGETHADRPAQDAPLHRLRMVIEAAETQWNAFCAGSAQALPRFVKNAVALSASAEQLGHTDYRRLAQAMASAARWLAEQPARHSEVLAMEIATAILLAQNAQENFHRLGGDFAHQVDVMVARIHGCIAENPPPPGSEVPALDEMSRQAQERQVIAQVAGEIHSNFAQIEQGLDTFFRDSSQRAMLPDLTPLLQQAVGALSMIGQGAAADALRACAAQIGNFAHADSDAQEADFERLAESLALLGFFVDSLRYGVGDFTSFARSMQTLPKAVPTALPTPVTAEPLPPIEIPDAAEPEVVAEAPPPPPAPPAAPRPTALPEPPVAAASEPATPIDAELLAIFLEEAHDVLNTIGEQLQHLGEQPHDAALLTTLRRAFHTLKGSGRMVGLKALGGTAAAVEQVLNRWLHLSLAVNAPLSGLLGQAHALFSAWVAFLEEPGKVPPDAGPLLALAESLERGDADMAIDEKVSEAAGEAAPEKASEEINEEINKETEEAEAIEEAIEEAPAGARIIEFKPPATAATPRITVSPTLRDIFLNEAHNHLATLNDAFGQPASAFGKPTPQAAPRAAHTLAGSAGTIGLGAINRCALALEHALLRRDRAADITEALEVVAQSLAGLGAMLDAVAAGRDPEAIAGLIDALEQLYPATPATALLAEKLPEDPPAPAAVPMPVSTPAVPFDEIDEQLLPIFLEEVLDLSEGIAAQLRAWRADPADTGIARTLARLLHTLKGSARMVGAMSLGEIVHAIETRIGVAQETGSAPLELIDEIDAAYDALLEMIDRLQSGEAPPGESADSTALAPPVADTAISAVEPAAGQQPAEAAHENPAEAGVPHPLLRVRADLVDRLVGESGELSVARARIESEMRALKDSLLDLSENVIRLRHQLRDIEIQAESRIQSRTMATDERRDDFDPLEIDRFTHFQELTRMMAESVNDVATVQQNLLGNVDAANAALLAQARLNRQLQQDLMSIRTLPFDSVADRLYRIVRQTGKELGKRANLEIHGGQVELDRSVLERLAAPLEHLLRNAIAHGLEERETRIARGKPEIGEISLTLAREGNEIVLTFADDGAGLDLERIRSRAITAGLLAADEAADTARIIDLIFAPGLSTAAGLSQLAGRGVGMDVVKNEISRLGGRIEVVTVPGKGTTFSLYIPLTLAVTQALLVRAGSQTYAIASLMIEQVLDLKDAALATIRDAGAAGWLGQQYPFAYLPQLLGDPQAVPEIRRKYQVLLLRSGNQRIAVQVDELQGKQEIVVKNVGEQLARVAGIDGATVLGNGQVVLILNPLALNSRSPAEAGAAPVLAVPAAAASRMASALPTVMVVDDSLTVRKITGRLLSREGYEVITAKDGVDALEKLLDVLPDLLLVDIEMPRMDGFDLTRNVRADPRLKEIPIIMITSRTADRHRNHALEIGVNQYLGKPYQEDELLRLVAGYVKCRI